MVIKVYLGNEAKGFFFFFSLNRMNLMSNSFFYYLIAYKKWRELMVCNCIILY
ncbi:hypothetical protein BDA99DRAFT_499548 [Phascolomyces articulosus]|uniref:Uncharacterized protein n=1 Tax=Phascolomyces articulosus TaxID=60185 RepID=A0AAD5KJP4_9FUNG|nr:hypothetical protein BDA99DRAFT_499548 [Phascolomyces articulosus]